MTTPTEEYTDLCPSLILAHRDGPYAVRAYRSLRQLGWEVHLAASGPEARRLARTLRPTLVVLDTQLEEESGWLTCDKLTRELPDLPVVLVEADPRPDSAAFATFVGASALIDRSDGVQALVDEVLSAALPVPI